MTAWPPFFNSFLQKKNEAVVVFGKVTSYYIIGASFLILGFFAFSRTVVYVMTQPAFHSSWTVVGMIASAQILWGAYVISLPGIIFTKRTEYQIIMEMGAAGLNIILNFLLIPRFCQGGAAFATLCSFLALTLFSFFLNYRYLPVDYEVKKITKVCIALLFASLLTFLPISGELLYVICMLSLYVMFCFFLWHKVLTQEERSLFLSQINFRKLRKSTRVSEECHLP